MTGDRARQQAGREVRALALSEDPQRLRQVLEEMSEGELKAFADRLSLVSCEIGALLWARRQTRLGRTPE